MPKIKSRDKLHAPGLQAATPGVVLLNPPSFHPVAYNREAVEILAFPSARGELKRLPASLTRQLRDRLVEPPSIPWGQLVVEFKSGNRTYLCRALDLRAGGPGNVTIGGGTAALLLERQPSAARFLKRRTCEEFGITSREGQIVELVLQGMTTKEIAQAMAVSPNTVKTFLRLIMTRMNVSTRSGIIGKILGSPTI